MAMQIPFTTTHQFHQIAFNDPTVEVVGYIDEVMLPVKMVKTSNYQMMKFILSNGEIKVPCLIWGSNLINRYQNLLQINRIVHIDGAQSKVTMRPFLREQALPYELIIRENTVLQFYGLYDTNQRVDEEPMEVDFLSIVNSFGLIRIKEYIKTTFSIIQRNEASYAVGALTDGSRKIVIQVTQFFGFNFIKGDYVAVTGRVRNDDGPLIIYCNNMNDITLDLSVPRMPLVDLLRVTQSLER